MKEYFIKLQRKDGEIATLRRFLDAKTAKFSLENIGRVDKHGTKLLEFWEIK